LVLAGVTAALALPGSGGGANPPLSTLRGREAALGGKTQAALLSLYSLDARLVQSHARAAALHARAARARAQLEAVVREKAIAQHAWRASVAALESHMRTLYEHGEPDELAVLLGASSIDDALTRLDEVERTAKLNRDAIMQTRRVRTQLIGLQRELERRSQQLHALAVAAEETTAQLARARARKAGYIASLVRARAFTAATIARLEAQAKVSAARRPAPAIETVSAPISTAPRPDAVPPMPDPGTLTVTATGYSLVGHTATGLLVGWGVVAVDPAVIPLGTRITIPGYGDGVAADTGGAVRGAAIDLWFPTEAQAHAWGRRTVTITLH
jgi:3D (Asp-Asp-Asp) domain-containing protein